MSETETFNVVMKDGSEFAIESGSGIISHKLKVKLARPDSKPPKVATKGSAGMDLFLDEDAHILPDLPPKLVGTGIHVQIPVGYVGLVSIRSGISDVRMHNGVGVIDSDYRGEIGLKLYAAKDAAHYPRGTRIAQMVIVPYLHCSLDIVSDLDDTERGDGGFGHTGLN